MQIRRAQEHQKPWTHWYIKRIVGPVINSQWPISEVHNETELVTEECQYLKQLTSVKRFFFFFFAC
jgi:hypothetical protein